MKPKKKQSPNGKRPSPQHYSDLLILRTLRKNHYVSSDIFITANHYPKTHPSSIHPAG
jgi:hypothetical protein